MLLGKLKQFFPPAMIVSVLFGTLYFLSDIQQFDGDILNERLVNKNLLEQSNISSIYGLSSNEERTTPPEMAFLNLAQGEYDENH